MKKLGLVGMVFFFLLPLPIQAQKTASLESCFTYYQYGRIKTNLTADQPTYSVGTTGKIRGTLVNDNTFPIVGVTLYAKLFRKNKESFTQNGHYQIDRLTLLKNLTFLPQETKFIEAPFPIPSTYPNGEYLLEYYLLSSDGFHYSGRPFLVEDTAGYSQFSFTGGTSPALYFDPNSLHVNTIARTLREPIISFTTPTLTFSIAMIDQRVIKTNLPITVSWYSFEDTYEENLVKTEQLTIPANTTTLTTTFTPPAPGAYIMRLEASSFLRSELMYRFAVDGISTPGLRFNDLGVTSFPANDNAHAYICFHAASDKKTALTKVVLSLLDKDKKVVDQVTIEDTFASEVGAISLPLAKLSTPADFTIRAEAMPLGDNQQRVVRERHYSCQTFAASQAGLTVTYSDSTPDLLTLRPYSICKEPLANAGYVEWIRISQNGRLEQEVYNLAPIPPFLPLMTTKPGAYHIDVKSGIERHEFDVVIPQTTPATRPGKRALVGIILFIIALTGAVVFFLKRRWLTTVSKNQ